MECSVDNIWDLKWNTEVPDINDCLKATILLPVPCLFLCTFGVLDIWRFFRKKQKAPYTWSLLLLTKTILCIVLILLSAAELWVTSRKPLTETFVDAASLTAWWKCFTYLLVLLILFVHKSIGCRASNMLCIFWFLQSMSTIFIHRSSFLNVIYEEFPGISYEQFIIDMMYCPLVYSQLILSLFSNVDSSKMKCAMEQQTFFLFVTYCWLDRIIFQSTKTLLTYTDLTSLPLRLKSTYCWMKLHSKLINNSVNIKDLYSNAGDTITEEMAKSHNLFLSIAKAFSGWFTIYIALELLNDVVQFLPTIFFDLILDALNEDKFAWRGYLYCGALVISSCLNRFTFNLVSLYAGLTSMQVKSALTVAIYRKALKLSCSSRRNVSSGEIINLMAVDVDKIYKFVQFASQVLGGPVKLLLSVIFLWYYLGAVCLSGICVIVAFIPLSFLIGKKFSSCQQKQMSAKDYRLKYITEIICGIKVVKLFAWEEPFMKKVNIIRGKEVKLIRKLLYYYAIASFIWGCAPFLIAISCYITYVLIDERNILTASILFVSLNIINRLRYSLFIASDITSQIAQIKVSFKRLTDFFMSEECDAYVGSLPDKEYCVSMRQASLTWDKKESPTLKDINLHVPKGSLVAIVGAVGSGKSSLLSAILGEMYKINGSVDLLGSVAYVPQQPWILNQTLEKNVTFNKPLSTDLYRKVIHACSLESDINQLPGGHQTEIGEKGINLSGGQKQRISLARAVYQGTDIYLLDDPLSAVDAHVGKHIFENVVGSSGLLKNKTRIMVTHNTSVLPFVDIIITMKDGRIEETGTYSDLIEQGGQFSDFIKIYGKDVTENCKMNSNDMSDEKMLPSKVLRNKTKQKKEYESIHEEFSKLIEDETVEAGQVKWKMYGNYFKLAGIHILIPSICFYCLYQAFEICANISLSHWSESGPDDFNQSTKYTKIGIVLGYGLLQVVSVIFGNLLMAVAAAKASKKYHQKMLFSFMRSPLSFYDTTPQGRIMNRFSKDIDVIDCDIPYAFDSFLALFFQIIGIFVVIGMNIPVFIPCLVPLGIFYYFLQKLFLIASRQLKRLESVSRSPIYSHFQESIQGISSIRSYGVEEEFTAKFEAKVDTNISCSFHWFISTRWIAVRLDAISISIIFISSFLSIYYRSSLGIIAVGLSLVYTLSITNALTWIVRSGTELENNAISIERIDEYSRLPSEAAWDVSGFQPQKSWPENGKISFKSYSTKYRPDLDLVLKSLNLDISSKEKVGIVGRTGAGKSSLSLALFRIIEPVNGTIEIDNVDITKIGLHALRAKLTIIPQDPVLFSGSLRSNIDPNDEYPDESIWKSLERAHLKAFFSSQAGGLNFEITEGGENLSVGQRQLVCLARTLLKKSKILILDEATAAVDMETDSLIQNTINTEFEHCTVITIAHRLNTIMDCDTILVMDSGKVVERGKPDELLKNKNSLFNSMMQDTMLTHS